jgi:hypothetical protein
MPICKDFQPRIKFDHISCDALWRLSPRQRRKSPLKSAEINAETKVLELQNVQISKREGITGSLTADHVNTA